MEQIKFNINCTQWTWGSFNVRTNDVHTRRKKLGKKNSRDCITLCLFPLSEVIFPYCIHTCLVWRKISQFRNSHVVIYISCKNNIWEDLCFAWKRLRYNDFSHVINEVMRLPHRPSSARALELIWWIECVIRNNDTCYMGLNYYYILQLMPYKG